MVIFEGHSFTFCPHVEVFTLSEQKLENVSHSRPQDRMLDDGRSSMFLHSNQKGWSDVLLKRASHHLHVFCITATSLNSNRLFSLVLLAIWYAVILDHYDDKHKNHLPSSPAFFTSLLLLLSPSIIQPPHSSRKWMAKRGTVISLSCSVSE